MKRWTLSKTLKSAPASNVIKIHQEAKRIIITRTIPTGSFAHNSLLYNIVSRLKAIANATVLSINSVRPTNHAAMSDLSRLTPRAVTNKAGCI